MFVPRSRHLLCLSLCLPLAPALACGPTFPMRLLDDRPQTLAQLPEGSFQFEISRLGQPIVGLMPVAKNGFSVDYSLPDSYSVQERNWAEQQGLDQAQQTLVGQLRKLNDARVAEQQGASLPLEIKLYTAGAVAFSAGDHELAAEYFRKVLALPAEQRALRSTWAAYSLGRALSFISEQANELDDQGRRDMRQSFAQTRQLSIDAFSDPLSLGVASLGEEARILKDQNDWSQAIDLYAIQNQLGSEVGYSSLKQVVGELSGLPDAQLLEQLKHPSVARLLTASLISHQAWSFGERPELEVKLIKLLSQGTAGSFDNADRLAALNYQNGDFATAQRLLEHAGDGGLAWWLRAKMALRDGDKVAAAAAYAKAATAFPRDESWGFRGDYDGNYEDLKPGCRVEGESALLALDRGDYVQAFELLYRSGEIYWHDAATVAERVLTLDELKQFVDTQVPAPPPTPKQPDAYYETLPIAAQVRELLGRRLLREGRYEEGWGYFDSPERQAIAKAYGEYRRSAESAWLPTRRAEAYYQAGKLARASGMEILGYEMGPDYHSLWGSYSLEIPPVQVGPFISADEVQRQQATTAAPDVRYHYRYLAGELGNQAADFLPHTSQAYAAVLCKAARWTRGSDAEITYYRRYVENGPFVEWAGNFGMNCQEPDFGSANKRYLTQWLSASRTAMSEHKLATGAGAGVVLGAAYWLWRRRVQKA
ncbi:hypothetical protein M5G25_07830 [Pseudomonas sp. TNT2022 ID357]|uniref:Tetratricopeptide repeat-containing protein n=1 Tax=Pseudomonas idahonensis TaxID=2942628 RepID=A0ABT5Q1X5_9PSED|nr:hypothetical protein [Pseudomonas idahonensis]MDD1148189.1 hypothetical protein [Pseudomonas idahonensis]